MARKKKESGFPLPTPAEIARMQGVVYDAAIGEGTRLLLGLGAVVFGYGVIKYAPDMAGRVLPLLVSAFTPKPKAVPFTPLHPEAAEPVRTVIDERQLGRSEMFRAVARPSGN